MKNNSISNPKLIIIVAILCFLFLGVLIYNYITRDITVRASDPGQNKLVEISKNYLQALNNKNYEELGKYLDLPEDDPAVEEQMERYGGRKISDVKVTILQEFPNIYRVFITGVDDSNSEVEIYIVVEWDGKKFVFSPT
ncbi:hypothetical protein ACLIA0_05195 [Bacillaceae bacterium W0354]